MDNVEKITDVRADCVVTPYTDCMFTGIIQAMAEVQKVEANNLTVSRPASFADVKVGDSIAICGVCLTITHLDDTSMNFDVVDTTMQHTTLDSLRVGDTVNLERAMAANGRFDGHMVQGHVEQTAAVAQVPLEGNGWMLQLELDADLLRYVIPKGSITIHGVSLTVADVNGSIVNIALVPHTLQETNLGQLTVGDQVNIETDMIVRSVAHMFPGQS